MRREAQNLLLIVVGATIVKITLDGSYLRYVKASLYPYLLLSGGVIVLLGLVAIARDIRAGRAVADPHGESGRPYWMLLVPAAVLLFLAPPALSTGAIPSADPGLVSATAAPRRPLPPVTEGTSTMPLRELVLRAHRSPDTLRNRTVGTAGFALPNEAGTGFDLGQLAIACCAADGQLLILHLDGPLPAGISEGTWLSVTGRVTIGRTDPAAPAWPTMIVDEARQIEPPKITYGY
ncbi:TIGR03943 family putative permease subunit [Nocardia sp. NPDC003345]